MSHSAFRLSSLTKKFIMALAGLFLITFLVVHLSINLLLLFDPSRVLFNTAAHFMGTNPFIQTFQWVLFAGFIIHIIYGLILQIQNWIARPVRYRIEGYSHTSIFSKFMIHTGAIVLIFLVIHMANFFVKAKFGTLPEMEIHGKHVEDMGLLVQELFSLGGYVVFYIIALLLLGFHLHHAFQSAFQSLGLNHSRYTPFIKGLSTFIAVVLTLGYICIPVFIYFNLV
ncbi:MAG TPA: succinate dehydrogenase cytochrome b subunit [Bacteroidales bacterium]|nr:succinate dehydrogenase cytochrome b subunit [Lentimicrobiaceae bacterium]HOH99389.1 succinate dehydrogenase cytochrome b subunit [Bacteroidales bacterium]